MLPFNKLPLDDFDKKERFHLAKNKLQEIRVTDLVHKDYETKLIDIRVYHNKTDKYQKNGVRFDNKTWKHFISILKGIDPSEFLIMEDQLFSLSLNENMYDYENIKLNIRSSLWPETSKKPNRGLLVSWRTPEGNISFPNAIFIPIGIISEFIIKEDKNGDHRHIIDDYKLIDLINYNLDKSKETELILRELVFKKLKEHYNEKWYKIGFPQGVKEYIENKKIEEQKRAPWRNSWTESEMMQMMTTGHLKDIIINKKNFNEIFSKHLGCNLETVRINLENFISLRNNWAHIKEVNDTYLGLSGYSGMIYIRKCLGIE